MSKKKAISTKISERKLHSAKNRAHIEARNKKFKNYAFFQFFSTTAIFLISLALGLTVYIGVKTEKQLGIYFFEESFKDVITFSSKESIGVFVALLTYASFVLWMVSMWFALKQIKNKQRSLFDTAFLLFFFVPMLSNFITIFCQISETVYKTPTEFVDQYKTKIEYLEELNKYIEKESSKADKRA